MSCRGLVVRSVQRVKLAEIHVFKRVRPATKERVAHATDDKDIVTTLTNVSLSCEAIIDLAHGFDGVSNSTSFIRYAVHEEFGF